MRWFKVKLSQQERDRYSADANAQRLFAFSKDYSAVFLGWQQFVQVSARSQAGRRAMLAHREAKKLL